MRNKWAVHKTASGNLTKCGRRIIGPSKGRAKATSQRWAKVDCGKCLTHK